MRFTVMHCISTFNLKKRKKKKKKEEEEKKKKKSCVSLFLSSIHC